MIAPSNSSVSLSRSQVLQAAFPGSNATAPMVGEYPIHIISGGPEPRWILIGDPLKSVPVLRSWRPFNLSSRLGWSAVIGASSIGLLPRLPGVVNSRALIDLSYWRQSLRGFCDDWTPVVHVGNPSHTRKAIVFFVDRSQRIGAVAKIPLVDGAANAILNEAEMLLHLNEAQYVPRILFQDRERGITAQSWLGGVPVSRELTAAHMDLLSRLAVPGGTTRVSDHKARIAASLDECDLPYDRTVLAQALEVLDVDEALPEFVEHRDFAPWNLKRLPDGQTGALDWEWAVPNGLPCQDICRFFYIQDALFNGPGKVWSTITSHPMLRAHYQRFSIPREALPAITMHYLLRVLCMDWFSGNMRLSNYGFRQIRILLERPDSARGL